MEPRTGFYRDGYCRTGPGDHGLHTVCAVMTEEFLRHYLNKSAMFMATGSLRINERTCSSPYAIVASPRIPTSRRRKVSISWLSVSVAANLPSRDAIEGADSFDFRVSKEVSSTTLDWLGSLSIDLSKVAFIVSLGWSLPEQAVHWPVGRPLPCTK